MYNNIHEGENYETNKRTKPDYIRSKKSFKSEGIVKSIFGRLLKELKNDKGFMKAVDDADKATEKL